MSDNKKYYYLKLKENFFEMDNIKIMESVENGYIYSNIIMKLYLKSLKYNGQLKMTDRIPYDPEKIDILSNVINHNIDHVKAAIKMAVDLDLITILDTGGIWITDIQDYIGHSSTESERKAKYRAKLKQQKTEMGLCPKSVSPEIEIEKELEKELKIDIKTKTKKKKSLEPSINSENRKAIFDIFSKGYQKLYDKKITFNGKELGCIKKLQLEQINAVKDKATILYRKCDKGNSDFWVFLPTVLLSQWNKLIEQKSNDGYEVL